MAKQQVTTADMPFPPAEGFKHYQNAVHGWFYEAGRQINTTTSLAEASQRNPEIALLPLKTNGWRKYLPSAIRSREAQLLSDLIVDCRNFYARVPMGSIINGSSWPFFSPFKAFGETFRPGSIHDRLYYTRCLYGAPTIDGYQVLYSNMSKFECDLVWYFAARPKEDAWHRASALMIANLLISEGVALVGLIGLIVFGWPAWWLARVKTKGNTQYDSI